VLTEQLGPLSPRTAGFDGNSWCPSRVDNRCAGVRPADRHRQEVVHRRVLQLHPGRKAAKVEKGGLLVGQPPTRVRIPEKELAMVGTMPIRTKAGRKQRPRGTTARVSTARACSSALQRRP
jgi:hypothetical protein